MRLPVQTYDLDSTPASSSRLVNCYVESLPEDARAPYLIRKSPGIRLHGSDTFDKLGALPGGGATHALKFWEEQNLLYAVNGGVVSSMTADGDVDNPVSEVGYIGTPSDNIDMDVNVGNLVIVNEPDGYSYDGTTFAAISDTDFTDRGAGDVEFLDNFLLFREPGTGRFFGADLGSATAFDPLNFATAEAVPDQLVGMISDNAQIFFAGTKSIEIWDTTGGKGFPFRRMINGAINKGAINGRLLQIKDNNIFWVADDLTVRMLNGMEPVKISHFAIDQVLQSSQIEKAKSFVYDYAGHNYYVLRLLDRCFVYDITTGQWHERQTHGQSSWDYQCAEKAWNKTILGSSTGADAWTMDKDTYTEQGDPLVMEWTYQPVFGAGQRIFHDRLEIVVETGASTPTLEASDIEPVISLEVSDDGGKTFQFMPDRSMGGLGDRFQRVVWHNLGSSYQRVYRASIGQAVPVTVTDTILQAKGGRV